MEPPRRPSTNREAAASRGARARYDNRVLQDWPRDHEPPRVWIGAMADYDSGLLHGRWIGVARSPAEIQADIDAMLTESPTAERTGQPTDRWAIFDAEGFGRTVVGPRDDVDRLSQLGLRIKSYGGAFAVWARLHEHDLTAQRAFRDAYLGHYDAVQDYVELLIDARNFERLIEAAVPAELRPYVGLDVAQLTADLVEYGDVWAEPNPDGGVWLFAGRQPL